MLTALACNCSSSVPLIRQFLSSRHHPDPFSVPLLKGEEAKGWVNKHNLTQIQAHLNRHSSFAIIVGWDNPENVHFADIALSSPQENLKAQSIVETFA